MSADEELQARLWAQFMVAAITGHLAAEGSEFRYSHRQDVASPSAVVADAALSEYKKRYMKPL